MLEKKLLLILHDKEFWGVRSCKQNVLRPRICSLKKWHYFRTLEGAVWGKTCACFSWGMEFWTSNYTSQATSPSHDNMFHSNAPKNWLSDPKFSIIKIYKLFSGRKGFHTRSRSFSLCNLSVLVWSLYFTGSLDPSPPSVCPLRCLTSANVCMWSRNTKWRDSDCRNGEEVISRRFWSFDWVSPVS